MVVVELDAKRTLPPAAVRCTVVYGTSSPLLCGWVEPSITRKRTRNSTARPAKTWPGGQVRYGAGARDSKGTTNGARVKSRCVLAL